MINFSREQLQANLKADGIETYSTDALRTENGIKIFINIYGEIVVSYCDSRPGVKTFPNKYSYEVAAHIKSM